MALNREDEGYSIKGTSNEYDAAEEIDGNIQDYCVTGEEGNYYQNRFIRYGWLVCNDAERRYCQRREHDIWRCVR